MRRLEDRVAEQEQRQREAELQALQYKHDHAVTRRPARVHVDVLHKTSHPPKGNEEEDNKVISPTPASAKRDG